MASKKQGTIWIIIAAAALILGLQVFMANRAKPIDPAEARSKGSPGAKVQIVEFIDLQCPACAHGAKVLNEFVAAHPQDVRVQLKFFPLVRAHAHAMRSAIYAECAARQNKFWPFVDSVLERQAQWSSLLNAEASFITYAKEAGLDLPKLDQCVNSTEALKAVSDDQTLGNSLGLQSTPTYFINNKMVVGIKSLKEELDAVFK